MIAVAQSYTGATDNQPKRFSKYKMPNMPSAIIALVALVNESDEVLLLKRGADVHCPNVWSFPGGKVKADELPLQAAMRELKEETALQGKHWRHISKHVHNYADQKLAFVFFFSRLKGNVSNLQSEDEWMWCKLDALQSLEMPDANIELVQSLLECYEQDLFPAA